MAYFASEEFSKAFGRSLSEEEAEKLASRVVLAPHSTYCSPVRRAEENKKQLVLDRPRRALAPGEFYVWTLEEAAPYSTLMLAGIVGGSILLCMFPVWPAAAKVGVWYLSVTLLLALLALVVVRYALALAAWIVGYDLWLFPNLWADEPNILDSFRPTYTAEWRGSDQLAYRLAVSALLATAAYWVYTQPDAFDGYVDAQRSFVQDLYSGTLLSDTSQAAKEGVPDVPDLADLEKEEAAEAAGESVFDEATEAVLNSMEEEEEEQDQQEQQGEQERETDAGAARDEL